ncbi:cbl-interacting serine/threonine-protein kinase 8 [Phtheirospermum japonicum]|uniref:non-specific serine/threonine protein kinase n=1 Tax=Phtheirospermum japonicum TaxID=374723 RepID=A0A830BU09_9LAMI|nr:cbl-interacting serine/threonine-protein kinase 8 [Phtheirospermum japonicum]
MKVLDRSTIIKHKMVDQIKREISIMKRVRHPYVVRLHEVIASRTKIYIILEFITGGELFDKIVHHGRLSESESRRYFQQLIDGVDYCHMHFLQKESVFSEQLAVLLIMLHQRFLVIKDTMGALADIWSCGVILYVLMAGYLPFDEIDLTTLYGKVILYVLMSGYLPFDEIDLPTLYGKIEGAQFSCPSWFPVGAKSLIHRILDPNPETRIRIEDIRNDEWFKRNYNPVRLPETEDVDLDDVNAAFDDPEDEMYNQQCGNNDMGPLALNAFDLIILSQGLNLAALFDRRKDSLKHQTRFVSQRPAKVVLSSMEVVAQSMGFKTHIRNYKMRVEGLSADRTSHFSVIMEIFEVAPMFIMVDIQKAAGDADEYLKPPDESCKSRVTKTKSRRR